MDLSALKALLEKFEAEKSALEAKLKADIAALFGGGTVTPDAGGGGGDPPPPPPSDNH